MPDIRGVVGIAAKPSDVWQSLSEPHAVVAWFSEAADVDLEHGRFSFWGVHTITVPTVERPAGRYRSHEWERELRFSWQIASVETRVVITLAWDHAAEETTVTITHENLPIRRHEEDAAFHDFWYVALENLRMYTLTGMPQPMPDYSIKQTDSVTLSVRVDGSPERVFQTISDPAELNRYFGRSARVDLREGGEISFGWDEGGPVKILELDAPHLLSYSWEYRGEPATTVTWTLEGSGGATNLTITHSGFGSSYRTDAYNAGWFSFLAIIRAMVVLGEAWKPVRIEGAIHGEV